MPETLQQPLAAFREVMQLTGWSQREISRRTGMTPSTICRILNGQITHTPCKKTRRRLGNLLAYVYRTQLCDVCNGTGIIPSVGYCPQCKGVA